MGSTPSCSEPDVVAGQKPKHARLMQRWPMEQHVPVMFCQVSSAEEKCEVVYVHDLSSLFCSLLDYYRRATGKAKGEEIKKIRYDQVRTISM
jgi:hypothetical protein